MSKLLYVSGASVQYGFLNTILIQSSFKICCELIRRQSRFSLTETSVAVGAMDCKIQSLITIIF